MYMVKSLRLLEICLATIGVAFFGALTLVGALFVSHKKRKPWRKKK